MTVWEVGPDREMVPLDGHDATVDAVAFGPDRTHLVAGGTDGTLRLWETDTGRHRLGLAGHTWHIANAAFSPDGQVLRSSLDCTTRRWDVGVGGARDEGGVEVLDPLTGDRLQTLRGPDAWPVDLVYSDDGRWLAGRAARDEFLELARDRVTRGLTEDECRLYP